MTNVSGHMGSPKAQAYLALSAVVAASTVAAKIVSPFDVAEETPEKHPNSVK